MGALPFQSADLAAQLRHPLRQSDGHDDAGETLAADRDEILFGHWMQAAGSEGVAAIQVFHMLVDSGVTVRLETKSSDEADSAAGEIGSVTISSATPQVHRFDVADAKDLVRYTIEFLSDVDQLHCQFLAPTWAPN